MQTTIESKPIAETAGQERITRRLFNVMSSGYGLLALSSALFAICEIFRLPDNDNELVFFTIHYLLALIYVVILIANESYGIVRSWRKEHIHKTMVLLNLLLVSAYALNRSMTVFHTSTTWLCVMLVITSAATLAYRFYYRLDSWLQALLQFTLGAALVLYLYLALYVAPFYPFGIIGSIVIGVGLHVFVPVTLLLGTYFLIRHTGRERDKSFYWVVIGAAVVILYATVFTIEWKKRSEKITAMTIESVMYPDSGLPAWTTIAQTMKLDWITMRILKSDLVYATRSTEGWDFFPRNGFWGEQKQHDPLVIIGNLFVKTSLNVPERKKILTTVFNKRHEAEDRLWRGSDLSTSYVVSDIDIYPDLRIAYTEKYLTIQNQSENTWRGQEAIYTFQLPEGSVVTSLSLWINGKEEKGILTSKQKAAQAYNTIVGVEVRDPSVVHWQEGNRVTVRVFPCTTAEDRRVKIGITSPLIEEDGRLKLERISIAGPDLTSTKETYRVRLLGSAENISLPENFTKDTKGNYVSHGNFDPEFEISFATVPLRTNQFTFLGSCYKIAPAEYAFQPTTISDIYLDINRTWEDDELRSLQNLVETKNVWAWYENDLVRLNHDNFSTITDKLRTQNFSLFPFYKLTNVDQALVITKGEKETLFLSDLKGSSYATEMEHFFANGKTVKVYNLGGESAAYIRSVREMRGIAYTSGSFQELIALLKARQFPFAIESEESVTLHDSHLRISKVASTTAGMKDNAPDHVARLFAYNDIMRKVGASYFNDDYINTSLIEEAATANVVSPVSSLVVLETKEDYERFGIKASKNSLQNASKQSSGAVPEPHEWALIILFALFAVYIKFKK